MLPGATNDVLINSLNAGAFITHSLPATDTVNSIAAAAPITLSGGTLSVAGAFSDSSTVTLAGATLANATVQAGTTLSAGSAASTLSDVTLAGTLNVFGDSSATIINSLTLDNGVVTLANQSSLNFASTEMLSASPGSTGTVEFTDNIFNGTFLNETATNGVLTVGAGVTIEALQGPGASTALGTISAEGTDSSIVFNGTVSAAASGTTILIDGSDSGGTWTNDGTIESVSGATLELGQPTTPNTWSNTGTITATGSTVDLGGTFTTVGLGTFNNSGGTVYLTGTLNNSGSTLALSATNSTWRLDNGTINGGTITTAGSAVLSDSPSAGGTLSGVTLAGTLDLFEGRSATITNGLTLGNGAINGLVELSNGDILVFTGSQPQTLGVFPGSTGTVQFTDNIFPGTNLEETGTNGVLTVGAGVTIEALSLTGSPGSTLGTISAEGTGSSIVFNGTVSAAAIGATIIFNAPGAPARGRTTARSDFPPFVVPRRRRKCGRATSTTTSSSCSAVISETRSPQQQARPHSHSETS